MVDKKVIVTDEEIRNPYKPKKEVVLRLAEAYANEASFMALLDDLNKSAKTAAQADCLLSFMSFYHKENYKT